MDPLNASNLVRIDPRVNNLRYHLQEKTLEITGEFKGEQLYQVVLEPANIRSKAGRMLQMEGRTIFYVYFPRREPFLALERGNVMLERFGPQMIPLKGRHDRQLDIRIYRISPYDENFRPFPDYPLTVDDKERPPGPGEKTDAPEYYRDKIITGNIKALGSPQLSRIVDLPLGRTESGAEFGLDIRDHLAYVSGEKAPGTYLLGLRRLSGDPTRYYLRIQVTDLSITGVEEEGGVRFFVTSLESGKPVDGARVRVQSDRGYELFSATTDANGMCRWQVPSEGINGWVTRVSAEKGDDVLVVNPLTISPEYADNYWNPSPGSWLYWASSGLQYRQEEPRIMAHVFSERPVYRPDEPVHIKGYIRQYHRGEIKPVKRGGFLIIEGPGNMVWRYPIDTTRFGSFYILFDESGVPAGVYSAFYESDDGGRYGHFTFRKEDYRIPRFEVLLHGPDTAGMDSAFDVNLSARYYAGGSAAGLPVAWRVTRFPYQWSPERLDGFIYSSESRYSGSSAVQILPELSFESVTSDEGTASIRLDPTREPSVTPRTYAVEATVTGKDDQTVTNVKRIRVLPPFAVAMKTPQFIEDGYAIPVEYIVQEPGGDLLPDLTLNLRLLRREWHSVLTAQDFTADTPRYDTDTVDVLVEELEIVSGETPQSLTLNADRAGVYIVEITGYDKLGRAQTVSRDLYLAGDEAISWEKPESRVFETVMDKSLYNPGDTAKIVLKSPFQSAWVLVVEERPVGNRYEWIRVSKGSAVHNLDIRREYLPEIPVHFVLIRGRVAGSGNTGSADLGKPASMAATAWIKVSPKDHMLDVKLEYPENAEPGDTVSVAIEVDTPDGSPVESEVTLWLVDEAVLALGREQRLDPLPDFMPVINSDMRLRDTRNDVVGWIPFSEFPGGGEGEMEPGSIFDRVTIRRDFTPVPYFNPAVITGPDGRVEVRLKLPDNLTNFKIRAKAAALNDRFGVGTGTIRVRLPVIVHPTLPRFIRPGDRFTALAMGRIVSGNAGPGRAEFVVTGGELAGSSSTSFDFLREQPVRIEFPIVAADPQYDPHGELLQTAMTVKTAVERLSDGKADAFEVNIPYAADRELQVFRRFYDLTPEKTAEIEAVTAPVREGSFNRKILVTIRPEFMKVAAGLEYLTEYPYGCTEQRMSVLRGQLAMKSVRELFDFAVAEASLERQVRDFLVYLPSTVGSDGLCAYWPGSEGSVALTAWVFEFLTELNRAGFDVSDTVYNNLESSLVRALRSDYNRFADGEKFAERCWALKALAYSGRPHSAYAAELARDAQFLNLESTAQVLYVLASTPEPSEKLLDVLKEKILRGIDFRLYQGKTVYDGINEDLSARNPMILPGEIRTLAEVINGLYAASPQNERMAILVDAVIRLAETDGWGTTNANAAAMEALKTVWEELKTVPGGPLKVTYSSGDDTGEIVLDGAGPMKILRADRNTNMRFSPVSTATDQGANLLVETSYLPGQPGSEMEKSYNGFVIEREMFRIVSEEPPLALDEIAAGSKIALQVGDVVEEHIRLVNPETAHFVAVTIPLAAGMEPLNPALMTAPPEAEPANRDSVRPAYREMRDDYVAYYFNRLPKGSYDLYFRTRASFSGSFTQPPAKVQKMYEQSVNAHTPGVRIVISPGNEPR